jgi:hypothetical protein
MKPDEYVEAANRMRAKLGGPRPKPRKIAKQIPPPRPLAVPLADLLNGKRIRDMTASEYLAAAKLIDRLKRFGSQSEPRPNNTK